MDEKTLSELQKMSRKEQSDFARLVNVELKPTWNRSQCAFAIKKAMQQQQPVKPAEPAPVVDKPENPDFVRALEEPVPDGRGGPRPGAGRPLGLTEEKAKVRNLPQQPNEAIVKGIMMLFSIWSRKVRVPEVALSDDEARQLALSITQLQEYYWPHGIPEIAWAWAMAGFTTYTIVNSRLIIIEAARKAKQKEQGSDGQTEHNDNTGQIGVGQNLQGDTAHK